MLGSVRFHAVKVFLVKWNFRITASEFFFCEYEVGHQKRASPEWRDSLAEWSKAVAQGAIPKGRGLEPHSWHFRFVRNCTYERGDKSALLIETCLAL